MHKLHLGEIHALAQTPLQFGYLRGSLAGKIAAVLDSKRTG